MEYIFKFEYIFFSSEHNNLKKKNKGISRFYHIYRKRKVGDSLKGFIADLDGGSFWKKLNYPISMLPIVFRSVGRKVNDH